MIFDGFASWKEEHVCLTKFHFCFSFPKTQTHQRNLISWNNYDFCQNKDTLSVLGWLNPKLTFFLVFILLGKISSVLNQEGTLALLKFTVRSLPACREFKLRYIRFWYITSCNVNLDCARLCYFMFFIVTLGLLYLDCDGTSYTNGHHKTIFSY